MQYALGEREIVIWCHAGRWILKLKLADDFVLPHRLGEFHTSRLK